MNVEELRALALSLPGATEDVKWGNDLCFLIGEKLFCATGLEGDFGASFKATPKDYEELIQRPHLKSAPYLGRYKWVHASKENALSKKEWKTYVQKSYEMVRNKLPKKVLKDLEN